MKYTKFVVYLNSQILNLFKYQCLKHTFWSHLLLLSTVPLSKWKTDKISSIVSHILILLVTSQKHIHLNIHKNSRAVLGILFKLLLFTSKHFLFNFVLIICKFLFHDELFRDQVCNCMADLASHLCRIYTFNMIHCTCVCVVTDI